MTEEQAPYHPSGGSPTLGPLFVPLAGAGHYRARAQVGEPVTLIREPDNPHDRNAIRVDNPAGETLGHIPRRTAHWMAPLLDTGRIRVQGLVSEVTARARETHYGQAEAYLRLDLDRVASAGEETDARSRILNEVRRHLNQITDPEEARRLGKWLMGLWNHDLEPEAKMLLAVMRSRGRALETPAPAQQAERPDPDPGPVRAKLQAVKIGDPVRNGGVSVYPLYLQEDHAGDYILLQEAMAQKLAEVAEVSEGGSVPELKVVNKAARPVLIPEGEILVGAKQDRAVNMTLLIEPQSEGVIPVSCVERGRWRRTSRMFASGRYATPGVRAHKTLSVNENLRHYGTARSDQDGVWDHVADYVADAGAESETGSLSDAFAARQERLDELRRELPLPDKAAGVVITAGARVLGMDLFDEPGTLQAIWPRLADGYFLEAVLHLEKHRDDEADPGPESTAPDPDPDEDVAAAQSDHAAAVFLENVARHLEFVATAKGGGAAAARVGLGDPLEIAGGGYSGSGLWYEGRICHLAGFLVG